MSGNSLKVQTTWTKKNHEQASLKRVDGIDKAISQFSLASQCSLAILLNLPTVCRY